ncbi:hypothetical protein HK097_007083, partial [Rhizophlyctis rosea]
MTSAGPRTPACSPGELSFDYFKPSLESIEHFTRYWGVNVIRVPITWERVQPALQQPLNPSYLSLLDEVILWGTSIWNGESVIIVDLFNFGRYNGQMLGTISQDQFVDVWTRLAQKYVGYPAQAKGKIWFALMNSPFGVDRKLWWTYQQAALSAIRSVGFTSTILLSGNSYSGAREWTATFSDRGAESNGRNALKIVDPLDNVLFDMTQFLDGTYTGGNEDCTKVEFFNALSPATKWLKDNGKKGFLGKFGVTNGPACTEQLPEMLDYLNNSGVWVGWTYYGAGHLDQTAISIESTFRTNDKPQMALLGKWFRETGNALTRKEGEGVNNRTTWDVEKMGFLNVTGWS